MVKKINTYFFPFRKKGCLKQCSLFDLFVLWKSYMLSCLMNDEKLLCLKNLGKIVSENSFCFLTTKVSPSGDQATMLSYFLSYNGYYENIYYINYLICLQEKTRHMVYAKLCIIIIIVIEPHEVSMLRVSLMGGTLS